MPRFTEWSPELEVALAEPFPAEFVTQKRMKGSSISFVSWHIYALRLNELVGPGWSMGEPILREVGGKLIMGLPITILGVTRINFGSEQEEHGNPDEVVDKETGEVKEVVRDFGSAETNAFAQAFKRTCSLFGLGLSMYDKHGAYARYREQLERKAHSALLDFIRESGATTSAAVQEKIRTRWDKAKQDRREARALANLIETETGERFQP